MSKRDTGLILKATFSKTQRADCEMTTDKYNERDSPRGPAPSPPVHALGWVRRPELKLPQSRYPCSLRATMEGDKTERTAFLKCQTVGVLLKYLRRRRHPLSPPLLLLLCLS